MKPTNAQWTVKKSHSHVVATDQSHTQKHVGSQYVLRNSKTGQFKTVASSPRTTVVMEKLAKDKIKMLKRLADR